MPNKVVFPQELQESLNEASARVNRGESDRHLEVVRLQEEVLRRFRRKHLLYGQLKKTPDYQLHQKLVAISNIITVCFLSLLVALIVVFFSPPVEMLVILVVLAGLAYTAVYFFDVSRSELRYPEIAFQLVVVILFTAAVPITLLVLTRYTDLITVIEQFSWRLLLFLCLHSLVAWLAARWRRHYEGQGDEERALMFSVERELHSKAVYND